MVKLRKAERTQAAKMSTTQAVLRSHDNNNLDSTFRLPDADSPFKAPRNAKQVKMQKTPRSRPGHRPPAPGMAESGGGGGRPRPRASIFGGALNTRDASRRPARAAEAAGGEDVAGRFALEVGDALQGLRANARKVPAGSAGPGSGRGEAVIDLTPFSVLAAARRGGPAASGSGRMIDLTEEGEGEGRWAAEATATGSERGERVPRLADAKAFFAEKKRRQQQEDARQGRGAQGTDQLRLGKRARTGTVADAEQRRRLPMYPKRKDPPRTTVPAGAAGRLKARVASLRAGKRRPTPASPSPPSCFRPPSTRCSRGCGSRACWARAGRTWRPATPRASRRGRCSWTCSWRRAADNARPPPSLPPLTTS